tara:strand:+ start:93 stop:1232 length:1140 start_codon:yes stop_codon:yes gene_type:complete
MPNILDNFFQEGLGKFPEDTRSYEDLPKPEGKPKTPSNFNIEEKLSNISEEEIESIDNDWIDGFSESQLYGNEYIPDEVRDLIDGGVRHLGFDILAFYKSKRDINQFPFPSRWGIFYFKQAIQRVAELIRIEHPGYKNPRKLALGFLRAHEKYHYKFDVWSLSVESAIGRSLYKPLKLAFKHHSIHLVEESLANRDALDWARSPSIGIHEFAEDFMNLQPGAYARFNEPKKELAAELAANLIDLDLSQKARRPELWPWVSGAPKELMRNSLCPEYLIDTSKLSSIISPALIIPKVLKVTESKKFLKRLNPSLSQRWEKTKTKLIKDPSINGLNFKPWHFPAWSVRVTGGDRAHLTPSGDPSLGIWEAVNIGDHKTMGHG